MVAKAKSANGTVEAVEKSEGLNAPKTMKPQILTFTIRGMSPLLQNNPANFIGKDDSEETLNPGKKKYNDEEEALLRVYKDDVGNHVHPSESFIKAMLRAVSGKKFGKVSAPGAIRGAVFIAEPFCIILGADGKPAKEYSIDRRSVVINKKNRVLRCRPCWNPWSMKLALDVDTAIIGRGQVLDSLSLAGRIIGVGDNRPEKGGGFGRFTCE